MPKAKLNAQPKQVVYPGGYLELLELKEFRRGDKANDHLQEGWVLLSTHVQTDEYDDKRNEQTIYCLGWLKSLGDVKYPVYPWTVGFDQVES